MQTGRSSYRPSLKDKISFVAIKQIQIDVLVLKTLCNVSRLKIILIQHNNTEMIIIEGCVIFITVPTDTHKRMFPFRKHRVKKLN